MISNKQALMQNYSYEFIERLKLLHRTFSDNQLYPRDYRFESAIYDSDKRLIFSTLKDMPSPQFHSITYAQNDRIYFIKVLESYYLGAKYLVLEVADNKQWLQETKNNILIYSISLFCIALIIGYVLAKQFLKPMRESILLLDRFIKDTTHELNTPLNTILANIEMIEAQNSNEKLTKKIDRIKIASKTISTLYQDLTYATLNHKIISNNRVLDLSTLIQERVEFFKTIAKSKRVTLSLDIAQGVTLYCDENKSTRLVDNLISNAIKYNKLGGTITIKLKEHELVVADSGIGIPPSMQDMIFKRYVRHDTTNGGFGIGLSIVYAIVKEYDFDITIESQEKIGTKVTLSW
jgi:two-component system OmpR family sensor kinase